MASCTVTAPTQAELDASGDNHYANLMNRWDAFFDWAWDAYDFDRGDWDQGFGYYDKWNRIKPLARTMAAIYCLVYSPGSGNWDPNGNILQWAWRYTSKEIDELDARCSRGTAFAYTRWGIIIDNYTQLYVRYFYNQGVSRRAGTLVHEARHADWKGHNDGSDDSSWEYNGAWRWHVVWLWWYYVDARNATASQKLQAKQRGNQILRNNFTNDPGFRIP